MENLKVEIAYLYPKENAKIHKTIKYEMVHDEDLPVPVLRRGLKFTMSIRFVGRNFEGDKDDLKIIFNFGPRPNPTKGTKAIIKVQEQQKRQDDTKWHGEIISKTPDCIILEVKRISKLF